MTKTVINVEWVVNQKKKSEALINRDNLQKRFVSLSKDFPHSYQKNLEELFVIIHKATSVKINMISHKKLIILEYSVGDTVIGKWTCDNEYCMRNFLIHVF